MTYFIDIKDLFGLIFIGLVLLVYILAVGLRTLNTYLQNRKKK